MYKINQDELMEILKSYGIEDLVFDKFIEVEPDTSLYVFHDDRNNPYCLVTTDYPGGYFDVTLPCDFEYDYYPDSTVKFHAICNFLYVKCATKKAEGYIDDGHLLTKVSTGDICVLYVCDYLEYGK